MSRTDYFKEFSTAVENLKKRYKQIAQVTSYGELSQEERLAQQDLYALGYATNRLGYWIKEAVDLRRREFRSMALDKVSPTSSVDSQTSPKTKATRRGRRTKATK